MHIILAKTSKATKLVPCYLTKYSPLNLILGTGIFDKVISSTSICSLSELHGFYVHGWQGKMHCQKCRNLCNVSHETLWWLLMGINMMVTDALAPNWRQGICNHHDDVGRPVCVSSDPTQLNETKLSTFWRRGISHIYIYVLINRYVKSWLGVPMTENIKAFL